MTWCFRTSIQLPKGQLSFVEKWPLSNSNDILFLLTIYFVFVFKIGPYIMEKRCPFQIKQAMLIYNAFKVVNSTVLAYRFFYYIMEKGLFPKRCDYDDTTIYTIAMLYWKYMVTKILDLFDTVVFVLRKKPNQITFLHVYHHMFMVIITWSCLKYDPSDHWAFMATVNCIIHAVMYTYYGLSAMGPGFAKHLWWKKYLTIMQLIQFVLVIAHLVIQTYLTQCPMHTGTYWVCLLNLMLFVILFMDFYKKRYGTQRQEKEQGFGCVGHVD